MRAEVPGDCLLGLETTNKVPAVKYIADSFKKMFLVLYTIYTFYIVFEV